MFASRILQAVTGWRWLGAGLALLVGSVAFALADIVPPAVGALIGVPASFVALFLIVMGCFQISVSYSDWRLHAIRRRQERVRASWTSEEWAVFRASLQGREEARLELQAAIRARGDAVRRRAAEMGVSVADVEAMDAAQLEPAPAAADTSIEHFVWDGSEASRAALTGGLHGRAMSGATVRVTMSSSPGGPVHVWTREAKFLLPLGSTLALTDREDSRSWSVLPPASTRD